MTKASAARAAAMALVQRLEGHMPHAVRNAEVLDPHPHLLNLAVVVRQRRGALVRPPERLDESARPVRPGRDAMRAGGDEPQPAQPRDGRAQKPRQLLLAARGGLADAEG